MNIAMGWTDSLLSGIYEVDKEHMHLVEMLNDVNSLLKSGDINAAKDCFFEFYALFLSHVLNEERLMIDHECQTLQEHREDHSQILHKLDELRKKGASLQMLTEIGNLFEVHFKTHDKELSRIISE